MEKRNDGYNDGAGFGLEMRPRDLLKIGQLVLSHGIYQETQIISKDWIVRCIDEHQKSDTRWGFPNSKHGYCWYSAEVNFHHVIYAMGYGGQFILIFPETQSIVVATHDHDTPYGIQQQVDFLSHTLPLKQIWAK